MRVTKASNIHQKCPNTKFNYTEEYCIKFNRSTQKPKLLCISTKINSLKSNKLNYENILTRVKKLRK